MNKLFKEYLEQGKLGFYQGASITSIILHNKQKKMFHNVYTLVTFQERHPKKENQIRYGSKKPLSLGKYSGMITTQEVSLETAINLYETLIEKGDWQQPGCPPLNIESLITMSPIFVPNYPLPQIVHGLKNPHRHCQYLFEFFAESKTYWMSFSDSFRKQLADWMHKYVPIDLNLLSDRWGNIIFQLPITLLKVDTRCDDSERNIHVHVGWHPKLTTQSTEVSIDVSTSYDDILLGFINATNSLKDQVLKLQSTDSEIKTRIIRKSDGLVLYQYKVGFIKDIYISTQVGSRLKRKVFLPDGETYQVQLFHRDRHVHKEKLNWKTWVQRRQHKESVTQLEKSKFFVQYGISKDKLAEHKRAITDIRELVGQYGGQGAYLWDPYCNGIDILNTLYACQAYGAPLRVITSRLAAKDDQSKKAPLVDKTDEITEQLKQGGNHEGINLEVRCQYGQYGWAFHDRFLLFPRESDPLVWSLGSSVNSIGKSHSILLKVEHAQPVVDAFNELWNQLGEAVIWKSEQNF